MAAVNASRNRFIVCRQCLKIRGDTTRRMRVILGPSIRGFLSPRGRKKGERRVNRSLGSRAVPLASFSAASASRKPDDHSGVHYRVCPSVPFSFFSLATRRAGGNAGRGKETLAPRRVTLSSSLEEKADPIDHGSRIRLEGSANSFLASFLTRDSGERLAFRNSWH